MASLAVTEFMTFVAEDMVSETLSVLEPDRTRSDDLRITSARDSESQEYDLSGRTAVYSA